MDFSQAVSLQRRTQRIAAMSAVATLFSSPFLFLTHAGAATPSSPWPMALHDAEHSATSTVTGPQTGHIAWKRALGGNITPGPVIGADGSIDVATSKGILYSLDPKSGNNRWSFDAGSPYTDEQDLSTSPLILSSGSILWPGPSDTLYELSSAGKVLWKKQFSGAVLSPTTAGGRVYVALSTGRVWALDVTTPVPTLVWSVKVGSLSFGSPVISPNGNVITTADDSVVAISDNGSNGSIRWQHTLNANVEVSPSVGSDGSVYVTSNHSTAYSYSASGALRWSRKIGQESYSSSSVTTSGNLVFGDNGGLLHVVKAASGDPVVTDKTNKGLWGAQAIDAEGNIYFGTLGKRVEGFTAKGHRLFCISVSGSVDSYPALSASGGLIVGDEKGTLYDIESSTSK